MPLQHSFSHQKVYDFTFNLNFGINKWSFKLIKIVMAVFPLFAPFRIYKNIHTQNFADNYLMLMPSVLQNPLNFYDLPYPVPSRDTEICLGRHQKGRFWA